MRKKHREAIIDITTTALEILLRFGSVADHAFLYQKDYYNQLSDRGFSRTRISNRVRELINSGNIEALVESGKKSVRLTRKGRIKLLSKSTGGVNDGQWRFISFDIPEKLKTQRFALTRILKRIGYKAIQKSLWACPNSKADEIGIIVDELGLSQYVANFKIDETDIKDHLEELFDSEL